MKKLLEEKFGIDLEDAKFKYKTKYRGLIDRLTVYKKERWSFFGILFIWLLIRLCINQTHAVIAYMQGIYYLKNIMLYLSPQDEYMQELEIAVETDYVLPMRDSDEFKGFQRKKQEMEVWIAVTFTSLLSFIATFFESCDMEICVPILVAYFFLITFFLFKVKIQHMMKYKYNPLDFISKKQYR